MVILEILVTMHIPPWSTNFWKRWLHWHKIASKGDVLNVAVDFDNNKIYFGINGTYQANDGGTDGDPANGTNESLSGLLNNGKFYSPSVWFVMTIMSTF